MGFSLISILISQLHKEGNLTATLLSECDRSSYHIRLAKLEKSGHRRQADSLAAAHIGTPDTHNPRRHSGILCQGLLRCRILDNSFLSLQQIHSCHCFAFIYLSSSSIFESQDITRSHFNPMLYSIKVLAGFSVYSSTENCRLGRTSAS